MKKDIIIILDFGSQYSHMIARRIRDIGIYSLLYPYHISINRILYNKPKGIILSGGPSSVYRNDSLLISDNIFQLDIPILGICYGMQVISFIFGGQINKSKNKEYGKSDFIIDKENSLFYQIPKKSVVWMSHFDEVTHLPKQFQIMGHTSSCSIAAFKHVNKNIYAVQFHPEVKNTEFGIHMLKNFSMNICKCHANWRLNNFIKKSIYDIKKYVSNKKVILGISGGLDSFVTAYIIYKAIGNSLKCIFVDTGLLLNGEKKIIYNLCKKMNFSIKIINAQHHFLSKLSGISNPEMKRKIVGREFVYLFQKESEKIKNAKFLAQGTIYSDVIESSISDNHQNIFSHSIKSHHNVGGLPTSMKLKLMEPLKKLFKDEVRSIGQELGIPKKILYRYPFPGPGLSIRIIGKINKKKIAILKKSEHILDQELTNFGFKENVSQAFIILLPIKSVGVMGDKRTYEYTAVLRAVNTEDFMTATFSKLSYEFLETISNRIVNEVSGINRVLFDITSKPPSTIEWE
ncbi:glutamine-hydrolyzing GMP synthase [Blattabacterium cuenoti]|uniref:glutamine-hydrolyzing GMP synthase n=1 Tax=Blattabacterium cuenoti TaxID=1653831 RepID=UPI00163CC24C|nr:glutamine-hydrolyzing GMP synthase [Blattabacterium cuenoti]